MTRKDYEVIAAVLKELRRSRPYSDEGMDEPETRPAVLADVALHLSIIFKEDNARFDRTRFLKACGVLG